MNAALKSNAVKVIVAVDKKADVSTTNCPAVGGWCYEDTGVKGLPKIELLVYSPMKRRLELNAVEWDYFRYKIFEALIHELVHRAQYTLGHGRTSLSFKPNAAGRAEPALMSEQQYLGEMDEIEAYARDCVEFWYYTRNTPLNLRSLKKEFRYESNIHAIQYYFDAYKGDVKHPAIMRFFRKVLEWNKLISPLAAIMPECPLVIRDYRRFTLSR